MRSLAKKVIKRYNLRYFTVCQERNESQIILWYVRVAILFFAPCKLSRARKYKYWPSGGKAVL